MQHFAAIWFTDSLNWYCIWHILVYLIFTNIKCAQWNIGKTRTTTTTQWVLWHSDKSAAATWWLRAWNQTWQLNLKLGSRQKLVPCLEWTPFNTLDTRLELVGRILLCSRVMIRVSFRLFCSADLWLCTRICTRNWLTNSRPMLDGRTSNHQVFNSTLSIIDKRHL